MSAPLPARHVARIAAVLAEIPGFYADGDDAIGIKRNDANETMILARELEATRQQIVEYEFPARRAREFVPLASGIDPGAETYTWFEMTPIGRAKLIANYADDLPRLSAYMTKNTSNIHPIGGSYEYSIQDLRRAALARRPLDSKLGIIAREAFEAEIDRITAIGDTSRNIKGLLNQTGVPLVTSGLTGTWASATAAQLLADLYVLEWAIPIQTSMIHTPNSLILPPSLYKIIATKPINDTNPTETVLSTFLKSSTWIKSVEQWIECETAGADSGPRALVYERSPLNLELVLPVEFESLPPQAENLLFVVPCHARIGGVVVLRPYAMAYCDALG